MLLTCEPWRELQTFFTALALAKYCAHPVRIRFSRRKDPWQNYLEEYGEMSGVWGKKKA